MGWKPRKRGMPHCGREMYTLTGSGILVCRTCDYATIDKGPVRSLREQEAGS